MTGPMPFAQMDDRGRRMLLLYRSHVSKPDAQAERALFESEHP